MRGEGAGSDHQCQTEAEAEKVVLRGGGDQSKLLLGFSSQEREEEK